jgi:hypothetical protein
VSASPYSERAKGTCSTRAIDDERLLARIKKVHERNYCASEGRSNKWSWTCVHLGRDVCPSKERRLSK